MTENKQEQVITNNVEHFMQHDYAFIKQFVTGLMLRFNAEKINFVHNYLDFVTNDKNEKVGMRAAIVIEAEIIEEIKTILNEELTKGFFLNKKVQDRITNKITNKISQEYSAYLKKNNI